MRARGAMLLPILVSCAAAAGPPAAEAPGVTATGALPTVTIEARRHSTWQRARTFVDHVVVRRNGESFPVWHEPVCVRVVGVADQQQQFIRTRLTQIIGAAGAKAGEPDCRANFYVVVTAHAHELIEAWTNRNDGPVEPGWHAQKRRLEEARPVRVWYDVDLVTAEGTPLAAACAGQVFPEVPSSCGFSASHLRFNTVGAFRSLVAIVDLTLTSDFSLGQLVDYIGLVGLVRMDLDADARGAPTLLTLFRVPREDRLQGLTEWDTAFLAALYQTDASSRGQDSDIARRMTVLLTH